MNEQRPAPRHYLIFTTFFVLTIIALGITGCDRSTPTEPLSEKPVATEVINKETEPNLTEPIPPIPPLNETFEIEPQLSLFPRAGDVRPEENEERFPYWKTFIEHIVKTSGPTKVERGENKTCWGIRGIKTIDSVGFFAPLAVQPESSYQVTFQIKTELAEGASAGIGILEFSEFLWVGNQFTEAELNEFVTGSQEGVRLTGTHDWKEQRFTFTTGANTNMIHLILFREGEHDRNPVLFDDISITPL